MDRALLAYDVYVGFDIGKFAHQALAKRPKTKTILSKTGVGQGVSSLVRTGQEN